MERKQKQSLIDLSISKGLDYLVHDDLRDIEKMYNTSLSEDPLYCLRLLYLGHITSASFSTWLETRGMNVVKNAVDQLKSDFSKGSKDACFDFATSLTKVPNISEDIHTKIIAAAAVSMFFTREGTGDPVGEALASSYLNEIFEEEYSKILFACSETRLLLFMFCALWKCNYPGVYEALEEYLPSKELLTDREREALRKTKRKNSTDMGTWIKIATNYYKDLGFDPNDYNPAAFILMLLLSYRELAASVITKRHPEFSGMEKEIKDANNYLHDTSSFNDEYYSVLKKNLESLGDINQSNINLHNDIYFSSFMAAHGSYIFQGDPEFWQQHAEKIFAADEEIVGLGHLAMIVVLLWSSNYEKFQYHLEQAIREIASGGKKVTDPSNDVNKDSQNTRASQDIPCTTNVEAESQIPYSQINEMTEQPIQHRRRRSERYVESEQITSEGRMEDNNPAVKASYNSTATGEQQTIAASPAFVPFATDNDVNILKSPKDELSLNNQDSPPVTEPNQHQPSDLPFSFKDIIRCFIELKSRIIICIIALIFILVFGFSVFKLLLGVIVGVISVLIMKNKKVLFYSSKIQNQKNSNNVQE